MVGRNEALSCLLASLYYDYFPDGPVRVGTTRSA